MTIELWIDEKLTEIGDKIKEITHDNPASFSCGYNVGYRQAILDLQNFIIKGIKHELD